MSPGIEGAAGFVGREAKRALQDVRTSGKNVLNDAKAAGSKSAFDIPGAMTFSALKNGGSLGLKLLVLRPSEWIFKFSSMLAVGGIKTGLQLASLIPIPMPGGNSSVAKMRASVADVRQAVNLGARGDPRRLGDIMQDLRSRREPPQTPAVAPAQPPAPTTPPGTPPAAV